MGTKGKRSGKCYIDEGERLIHYKANADKGRHLYENIKDCLD
jgi:hypothetical protein